MSNLVKKNLFWPSTSSVDDFLTENLLNWPGMNNNGNFSVPKVNIMETDEDFQVELAAPGMKREDFNIELDNDNLIIWSEISNTNEDKDPNYARREFSYESFRRSFYLPNTVEADQIEAKYQDGLLRLVIPKKEEAKRKPARRIEIS